MTEVLTAGLILFLFLVIAMPIKMLFSYLAVAVGYGLIQFVQVWRIFLGTLIVVLPFIILAKLIFE